MCIFALVHHSPLHLGTSHCDVIHAAHLWSEIFVLNIEFSYVHVLGNANVLLGVLPFDRKGLICFKFHTSAEHARNVFICAGKTA